MKNISLAMITLFTTLSVGTLSSAVYAEDDSTSTSGCMTCGCKKPSVDNEGIHRETVDNDSAGSTEVTAQ